MFGNGNNNSASNNYSNQNGVGTTYLRNTVRARIYSGDSRMEELLTQAQLFWRFYNNKHWAKNEDKFLSFNYLRAVIDKVNNFLIGKEGFEINISDSYGDEVDPDFEKYYEALINYNWRKNKKKTFLQNSLQMGSVTGNLYIFLYPNPSTGYVEYNILDSRTTIPTFEDGDYSKITGYRIIKTLYENEKKYIQKVTHYTKGNVQTYYVKDTGVNAEKFEVENATNDYDFIPIVHIENVPMSDGYGGKSDMADIVKLNKVYNEMSQEIKMIIDYYAQPTTVITGGTVGSLKKGLGKIWSGLPADAQVFNLTLGEDLSASMNFLKMLKESIHDLSGVPEEVLSKVQHISNTSAAALQMMYQPIIQAADKKAVSYGEGFAELHRMTCIMFAKTLGNHPLYIKIPIAKEYEGKESMFFSRFTSTPIWKYNLPSDRLGMINEAAIEIANNIASRKEVMERLGKENIPKLLKEIEDDMEFKKKHEIKEEAGGPNNIPPSTE